MFKNSIQSEPLTMHGEVPQFKRCCFCLPLRRGLIGWSYAKLCLNIWIITYLAMMSPFFIYFALFVSSTVIAILALMIVSLVFDVSFNIILIVAGHRKNFKLLRISYTYNLIWLGFVLAINALQIYLTSASGYLLYKRLSDLLIALAIAFSSIFVQVYLILLIRSELIKLRNQSLEMQFTNHEASGEAQCTLHKVSTSDTAHTGVKTQDNRSATFDTEQCTS